MYVSRYSSTPPVQFVDKYADQRVDNKIEQWKNSVGNSMSSSDTIEISEQARFLSKYFDSPPDLSENLKPWYFPKALEDNYKLAQDKSREITDQASEIGINLNFDEVLKQIMLFNGISNPSIKNSHATAIDSNGNERTIQFQSVHRLLSDGDKVKLKELHNHANQENIDTTTVANLATKFSMDKGNAMDRGLEPPKIRWGLYILTDEEY
ncbi:MAG: hypothetical protein OEW58_13360 [Gammaproteobacteria bacterium]|nr:hypothetical protein [Gammaproteobacteria bacterium]